VAADQVLREEWLPGYQIGQVLGRGGFSVVYQARQSSLGRDVAVKVLTTDLASEGDRRRFEREREALARLSPHPNVVDVIDAGVTAERRPFVVMRLYPGGSLADRLARYGALPVQEAIDVITKVASALDAAHAIGVLHRDVKPQNVLLTETGEPVLADFGIAGIAEADRDASCSSTTFFTMAHVAPEILEYHRYSVASDVYALASTTYQLLTGRSAFDPADPRVGTLILDAPPPPITTPGVPPRVAHAVLAALAKDPAARPPSAGAFAAALSADRPSLIDAATTVPRSEAPTVVADPLTTVSVQDVPAQSLLPVAAGFPAVAGNGVPDDVNGSATGLFPNPADTQARPARSAKGPAATGLPGRRAVLAALAVGTASVATGTSVYLRTRPRGPQVSVLTGHTAAALSVAWSPDGTALATSSADLTVRLWDATARRPLGGPLTGHTAWAWSVAWSPDGKTLATAGGEKDMTVRLWEVGTRQPLGRPLTGHAAGLWAVTWSPSGDALATASNDRTARIWSQSAHRQVGAPLQGHTDGVWSVDWHPNGNTVATTGGDRDATVRLWDATTHRQVGAALTGHTAGVRAVAWSPDGRTLATASTDATVRLWDPSSHQQLGRPLTGHTNWVNGVAWHPDGRTLATASGDRTVRLWDVATHRQLGAALTGHTAGVRAVAWSPDGKTLATASTDRSVRLWSGAW
jgi:Tol biopolymer transport system component/predicted Ser/Thr protein kinase